MRIWYAREDSNLHPFRDWNLNPARLPVPPLARGRIFRQTVAEVKALFWLLLVTPAREVKTARP